MRISAKNLIDVRIIGVMVCLVFVVCLAAGLQTKIRPGQITWGPTVDFWAIAIAISNIEYGLSGEVGYRRVSQELARHLSGAADDMKLDEATRAAIKRPDLITGAIRAAANLPKDQLRPMPLESGAYVSTLAEDVGYADFYNLAFRIFGYQAFSTSNLYVTVFGISLFLFVLSYWKNHAAVATLVAATGAFFITCNSGIFSEYLPSIAANRFLSTLGIIPLLHLMWAIADEEWNVHKGVIVVLQAVLLTAAINLRSSAFWMVLAVLSVSITVFAFRALQLVRERRWPGGLTKITTPVLRPVLICGAVILTLAVSVGIRNSQLHPIYSSDDALPYHVRWHSAWLGLTLNPVWPERKPFPELPNIIVDDVGYQIFTRYMQENLPGVPITSPTTGNLLKAALLEQVLKREFIRFASANQIFLLKTYFWYKPISILQMYFKLLQSVSIIAWIMAVLVVILVAGLFIVPPSVNSFEAALALFVLVTCSSLPSLWAYASPHVFGDQFIVGVFGGIVVAGIVLRRICLRLIT
jgi:hypothetical protein